MDKFEDAVAIDCRNCSRTSFAILSRLDIVKRTLYFLHYPLRRYSNKELYLKYWYQNMMQARMHDISNINLQVNILEPLFWDSKNWGSKYNWSIHSNLPILQQRETQLEHRCTIPLFHFLLYTAPIDILE